MLRSQRSENDWGPNCSRLKGTEERDMESMSNVQSWVGSFVIKDIIGSVAKLQWGLWIKGIWEFFVLLYDFFMRLKLFPCTKEKRRKKKLIHDYTVHAANIETIVFCFLFLALTPAIYQSMIWKYVCLWSYGRIQKIETDPCSKTNGPWSFTS